MQIAPVSFKSGIQSNKTNFGNEATPPQEKKSNNNELLFALGGLAVGAAAGLLIHNGKITKLEKAKEELSKKLNNQDGELNQYKRLYKKDNDTIGKLNEEIHFMLEQKIITKNLKANNYEKVKEKYPFVEMQLDNFLLKEVPSARAEMKNVKTNAILVQGDDANDMYGLAKSITYGLGEEMESANFVHGRYVQEDLIENLNKIKNPNKDKSHQMVVVGGIDEYIQAKPGKKQALIDSLKVATEKAKEQNITLFIPTKKHPNLLEQTGISKDHSIKVSLNKAD